MSRLLLLTLVLIGAVVGCNSEGGVLGGDNNNDFATATSLEIGRGFNGTIFEQGDNDYFKVTLVEAGVLDIALQPVPSSLGMNLYIYDGERKQIGSGIVAQAGQGIVFDKLVRSGTYYFKLGAGFNQSSATPYTFTISLDTTDKNEWNNSQSDAKPIGLGQPVKGTIRSEDDNDFFTLDLTEPGLLKLTLEPVPSSVAMNIELQGEDQKRIKSTATESVASVGQRRDLNYMAKPGKYYVLLSGGFNQESRDEYTFVASLDTTDINEVNDTFTDATTIDVNQDVKGRINIEGDEDFFKFTIGATTTLDIVVTPPSQIRGFLELYDTDQRNRIAYGISNVKGQEVKISNQALTTDALKTYYIRFEDYLDSNVSDDEYTLRITTK